MCWDTEATENALVKLNQLLTQDIALKFSNDDICSADNGEHTWGQWSNLQVCNDMVLLIKILKDYFLVTTSSMMYCIARLVNSRACIQLSGWTKSHWSGSQYTWVYILQSLWIMTDASAKPQMISVSILINISPQTPFKF